MPLKSQQFKMKKCKRSWAAGTWVRYRYRSCMRRNLKSTEAENGNRHQVAYTALFIFICFTDWHLVCDYINVVCFPFSGKTEGDTHKHVYLHLLLVCNSLHIMSAYLSLVCKVVALQLDHISWALPALVCLPCQSESGWIELRGLLDARSLSLGSLMSDLMEAEEDK